MTLFSLLGVLFFNSNTGATLATGTNWATEATGSHLGTSFEQKSLCT